MDSKKSTPEQLKSQTQKIVEEKRQIIADLNQIKYPLSATVFTHGASWTIRNKAFWKEMQGRDETIIDFIEKYLTEQK